MQESSDGRFPVSEDHLRLERSSTLDQHPEHRSLQAFFEAGFRPPTHQEAADIVIRMFRERDEEDPGQAAR